MKTERHSILDDPKQWKTEIRPPAFDMRSFQKRINERTGVNREGKPILKLVWAPEVWTHALGEKIKRYWHRRFKEGQEWVYISPPRFILERRVEREAYWAAHQAARFQTIEATGEIIDHGPPPEEYYVFAYLIAAHDEFLAPSGRPQCCEDAWEGETKFVLKPNLELVQERVGGRRRCWGYYREPNDEDLTRIEQAVRVMNEDKFYDPYSVMTPEQLLAAEAEANLETERMREEVERRKQEQSMDFEHSYGWRLQETDAGRLSHGRYHFLGQTWKAGKHGLTVPIN